MSTKRLSPRDSISMSFPMSRVAHSMTYSLARQETSSRFSFLATLFKSASRSSSTAKVMRLSFFPVKSNWICTGVPLQKLDASRTSFSLSGDASIHKSGFVLVASANFLAVDQPGRLLPLRICDRKASEIFILYANLVCFPLSMARTLTNGKGNVKHYFTIS